MYDIRIISVGPGSRDYITQKAVMVCRSCEIVVGMAHQFEAVGMEQGANTIVEKDINVILNLIEVHRGKKTGVLVTGDSGIFSLSRMIYERFGRESVTEVVPGVSSIQTAFARVKETWHNVEVFSYHARRLDNTEAILKAGRAAILCGSTNKAVSILQELDKYGIFNDRIVYICQDLTFENERVLRIKNVGDLDLAIPSNRELIVLIRC